MALATGPLTFVMHRLARNQCDMVYCTDGVPIPRGPDGVVEFHLSNVIHGWLLETERPVSTRRPYPEDEIQGEVGADPRTIHAAAGTPPSFSSIEILVALTKRMHQLIMPDTARWIFARLELSRPLVPADSAQLRVALERSFGSRFTQSLVTSGDASIGHIFFAGASE